jgi:hypothetical protein
MRQDLRVRLTAALVLGLVFVAGFVVGLAVERPVPADSRLQGSTPAPAAAVQSTARTDHDRVMKRIDLTKEQRITIDSLLGYYQERMAEFQKEYGPRYWAIVDSSRSVIKEVLTEEQAVLYDSLLVENDKRRGRPGASNGSR